MIVERNGTEYAPRAQLRVYARGLVLCLGVFSLSMVGACSSTTSTAGASGAGSAQTLAAADKDNDAGIVCREVPRTGTRITDRVCTTAAQRKAAREASRDAVTNIGIGATQAGGLREGGT
jgi:hypothetical protein